MRRGGKMKKISIVVPCYNEEEALGFFYHAICETAEKMNYAEWEFIFIDDGSADSTLDIMRSLALKDERVRYRSFSRNFGKESAMLAGIEAASGDFVAIMDADLQDPPVLLPEMYALVGSGEYDCAAARRVTRKGEPRLRSALSRGFYKIINKMLKFEIADGARDFRLMNRKMVDAVLSLGEHNRFLKGIFGWVGFKTKWIEYENIERVAGETKWSFWKLVRYSLEGASAFSAAPLVIATALGAAFCTAAFITIIAALLAALFSGNPVSWHASLVSLLLFIGGAQLLCTGFLGQYLSKMYFEVKNRPQYIVRESDEDIKNKEEQKTK